MHFLNIQYESTNIKIVYIFKEVAYRYIYTGMYEKAIFMYR